MNGDSRCHSISHGGPTASALKFKIQEITLMFGGLVTRVIIYIPRSRYMLYAYRPMVCVGQYDLTVRRVPGMQAHSLHHTSRLMLGLMKVNHRRHQRWRVVGPN